jgi:hypothetical protein
MLNNLFLFFYSALFAGILQAQTVIEHIPSNTPDSRYTLHSDGTVTDNATGLMWQRCNLGQTWDGSTCTGSISYYNWQSALQQGNSNSFAGYNDWRLPDIHELLSLVAFDRHGPAINTTIFPNTSSTWHWSSSPNSRSSSGGLVIEFYYGSEDNDSRPNTRAVRLLRGGQ